jgi:benzoate membrane transport protein
LSVAFWLSSSLANGLIALIFSATGPVAVILAVGTGGGLSQAELASWVFGVFFINGLMTLAMSLRHRTPLGFGWTIPGTVLVGPALQHMSFAEVIGAFYATSVLILVLGASGWVKRVMSWLPMPIVMGMVAGVFLRFGPDLVRALHSDVAVAAPMVLAFIVLSAAPSLGRRLPRRPVSGAWRSRWCRRPSGHWRRWWSWSSRWPSRCWWCRTARAWRC